MDICLTIVFYGYSLKITVVRLVWRLLHVPSNTYSCGFSQEPVEAQTGRVSLRSYGRNP
jgi:hypothetical protein